MSETEKKCNVCRLVLDYSCYYAHSSSADGLRGDCKECYRKNHAKYRPRAPSSDDSVKRARISTVPTIPGEHLYVWAFWVWRVA